MADITMKSYLLPLRWEDLENFPRAHTAWIGPVQCAVVCEMEDGGIHYDIFGVAKGSAANRVEAMRRVADVFSEFALSNGAIQPRPITEVAAIVLRKVALNALIAMRRGEAPRMEQIADYLHAIEVADTLDRRAQPPTEAAA